MQDTIIMSQTPTTVNEVMAPSSGNIELLKNHTILEVVKVGHSLDMSLGLNVGPAFPTKVSMEETLCTAHETSRELSQRRTREQAENDHKDIHIEHKKKSQSHEIRYKVSTIQNSWRPWQMNLNGMLKLLDLLQIMLRV